MSRFAKSAAFALALSLIGGAALAAEACACCKDGAKMACCDKTKKDTPKTGEAPPAPPEHKH